MLPSNHRCTAANAVPRRHTVNATGSPHGRDALRARAPQVHAHRLGVRIDGVSSPGDRRRTVAVILAGAVAKGAFEAGALQVLAEADVQVVRIVAASSGALNGVTYAAAVRARRERAGAAELVELWRDHATWTDIVHVDWREVLHREAVSDLSKVREILRAAVRPCAIADPAPINLRLVIAPLDGVDGDIAGRPATSYEKVLDFDGTAFDDPARLEAVFTGALASSSFPLVFTPTDVPGLGRCVDGGAVNNAPIGWAMGDALGQSLDAVVMISATVERVPAPFGDRHGADYVGHLVEMLINERLYRDLRVVEQRNARMRALDALGLASDVALAVRRAVGWEGAKPMDVVQIRPFEPLPGSAFSAFRDHGQRQAYIDAGAERARDVLSAMGWA
jgi:NTE family protein